MNANGNSNSALICLRFLLYAAVLLAGIAGNYALTAGQVGQNARDIQHLEETKAGKDLTTEQLRSINERLQRIESKLDRIEDRMARQ